MNVHTIPRRAYHMAGVIVGCCWFTVGLKLFMNTLTFTSPSARPVIMAAEVKDKANRGVVLCAYDAKSLRLAWIQVRKNLCFFNCPFLRAHNLSLSSNRRYQRCVPYMVW